MNELDALRQIAALAEHDTAGPSATPPYKAPPMSSYKATSLRGSISTIARTALGGNDAPAEQHSGHYLQIAADALREAAKVDPDDLRASVLRDILDIFVESGSPGAAHPYHLFWAIVDEQRKQEEREAARKR